MNSARRLAKMYTEDMIERRHSSVGIVGRCLPEVCPTVGSEPPAGHSGNGVLKSSDASGYRDNASGGLNSMGSNGNYWSYASNSQTNARNLNFNSGNVNPLNNNNRANGFSVRPCQAFGNSASPATVTATDALLFLLS